MEGAIKIEDLYFDYMTKTLRVKDTEYFLSDLECHNLRELLERKRDDFKGMFGYESAPVSEAMFMSSARKMLIRKYKLTDTPNPSGGSDE